MKLNIYLHNRDGDESAHIAFDTNSAYVLPDVIVWSNRAYVNRGENSRDHSIHYHEANTFVVGAAIVNAR